MLFANRKLAQRSYTLVKTLLITKYIQIIGQKKFAAILLDLGKEAFVMHVAYLNTKISIYLAGKA